MSDFDRAYCGAWLNGWIYQECLALDIQWQLVSYEYLTQLLEFSNYLNGSYTNVSEMPTFYKYFSLNNPNQTLPPKFIQYISHDEIMGAFFRALGSEHIKGALPASDIYVEYYVPGTDTSEERFLQEAPATYNPKNIMVRIFFNDTYNQQGEILDVKQSRAPMTLA